jgi:class 3 adenylate cyclase
LAIPTTQYARSGEASIAYQVMGEGSVDLMMVFGWISHLDRQWDLPASRRFLERLADFSRLILYDRRGSGLSDDLRDGHTIEDDVEDALAVLDAAGSDRAALYTKAVGGAIGAMLAAEHPERVTALLMFGSAACTTWAPDYDWVMTSEERERLVEETLEEWSDNQGREMARWAPSMADDPALGAWWAQMTRSIASPGKARKRWIEAGSLDARECLPRIRVPTLVMHRPQELVWDVRHSQYLAEHIPDARYVELEGRDSVDFLGDSDAIAGEIEEFLTGVRSGRESTRALLTVMFTDIVDSTARASELGDERWRDLLAGHDRLIRGELSRFGGREVKTIGDGFLATFAGPPSSALHCAQSILAAAGELGIEVRVGLHTGECELIGDDIGGMAVHVAARIGALAGARETLVSSAVSGTVVGGPFAFEDRGSHELKGVPGRWRLFALLP